VINDFCIFTVQLVCLELFQRHGVKKRIFFTGVTSIHGYPVFNAFLNDPECEVYGIRPPKVTEPCGTNIISCCITNRDMLNHIRKTFQPTHVIHCAGVCDLDVCEERPHWAHAMNTDGASAVADVFNGVAKIFYLSADLVFSGNAAPEAGYNELCLPDPVSVVGKTIAAAEKIIEQCDNACIVRLGLPIGTSVTGTKGAIDFVESRFRKNLPVTLFLDEFRSCIQCSDIVKSVIAMVDLDICGYWHLGGPVKYSLYNIGKYILDKNKYPVNLLKGILRKDEQFGPPRMGDVSLDSSKLTSLLGFALQDGLFFG
jgi:dTDP-4-dehydrorhamnose reductase